MALNGDTLGLALSAAVQALSQAQKENLDTVWKTIGNAIVDHIKTNAVVTVSSVSGVTVGGGVSGPGAGTIS